MPLVYWIDEILITSTWAHAQEWTNHILEFHFYRESAAAIRFYEKAIEAEKRDSTDPLETFFLCVVLGFRGELASQDEEIRRWALPGPRANRRRGEAPRPIPAGADAAPGRARARGFTGRAVAAGRQPACRRNGASSPWLVSSRRCIFGRPLVEVIGRPIWRNELIPSEVDVE